MAARLFFIPNPASLAYDPGPQPYSPGESEAVWGGHQGARFSAMPWPTTVQTIRALANNPGTPHMRAILPVVNRYSPLPSDYMYMSGFVGKSKG